MENDLNPRLSVGRVDWWSILIYAALVLAGWLNIYAAVYDDRHASIFDLSQRYGMQLVWVGVSAFMAVSILLIDAKYYHILAYPLYWGTILILVGVLFFGKEVNGAKSWIMIGPVALQPTEFVKFTTSLALARYMSSYTFDIHRPHDLLRVGAIIGLPVLIVMLQNDTGSALVYGSFLFMFYREGFNRWVYVVLIMVVSLFVFSFLLDPAALLIVLLLVCVISEGLTNGYWRSKLIYVAALTLFVALLYMLLPMLGGSISLHTAILVGVVLSLGLVAAYAYRYKVRNVLMFVLFFFRIARVYLFDRLRFRQYPANPSAEAYSRLVGVGVRPEGVGLQREPVENRDRFGRLLRQGLSRGDPNEIQLRAGAKHRFHFFCTVGEEWGFLGSALVIVLFGILILRLVRMGERQMEPFGRIYCYCVASIFFFHVLVNIGMTIGLMPVIGIPLPFFQLRRLVDDRVYRTAVCGNTARFR